MLEDSLETITTCWSEHNNPAHKPELAQHTEKHTEHSFN